MNVRASAALGLLACGGLVVAVALLWWKGRRGVPELSTGASSSSAPGDAMSVGVHEPDALVPAPSRGISHLPPPSSPEAVRCEQAIDSEIKELGENHPWAGHYYQGDGFGDNCSLALAPVAGFTFQVSRCIGSDPLIHGSIRESEGVLELQPSASAPEGRRPPSRFMVVVWGSRHYLIPPECWPSFVLMVREDERLRLDVYGDIYLRDGDRSRPVGGPLQTPRAYREAWERSLHAHVVQTGGSSVRPPGNERTTHLQVDVGSLDGVERSMTFYPDEIEDLHQRAIVADVHEHSCEVELWQPVTEPRHPAPGWRLSVLPNLQ